MSYNFLYHRYMEKVETNIIFITQKVKKTIDQLKYQRRNDEVFDAVYELARDLVDPESNMDFDRTGRRNRVRDADLGSSDQEVVPGHRAWYKRIYNEVLDGLISEYTDKFAELPTFKFLELLNKESFDAYSIKFPTELLMGTVGPGSMCLKYSPYSDMFDLDALRTDLTSLYMTAQLRLGVEELLVRYSEEELGTCFPVLRKL